MRNIKLILEYDGTGFAGWQRQPDCNSVQAEIENALLQLIQEKVVVNGGGRTDSGVHARGQVANFRCESVMDISRLKKGLQALVSDSISIIEVEEVPHEFHARYSAKSRTYSYLITQSHSALLRNYTWFIKYKLDYELLQKSAELIIGTHDFSALCKLNSNGKHHLCEVVKSNWTFTGKFLKYEIEANRFLHEMVRSIVGTMIDVARGYITLNDFEDVINKLDRTKSGQSAPPQGLVLENIQY